MDYSKEAHSELDLVRLQMAHHMPGDEPIDIIERALLGLCFLHSVLAQMAHACVDRLADGLGRDPLRHRDQRDLLGRPPAPFACRRDSPAHIFDAAGDAHGVHARSILGLTVKQMDRRLLILTRLREETAFRAADLAEECECSVRTIYRDIDALCQAGVPVAAMPGEGYRLAPGYHLPPIAFTVEEAVQLLLGSDLAHGLGTAEQREAARSAAAKVEAALRPDTRAETDRLRQRIRVSDWLRREPTPWLAMLQQAVAHDRVLWLQYHSFSSDELTERKVEPYSLIFYGDDWHVVGYCRLREGMRDFRASRIRDAQLLPERFQRMAGMLLAEDRIRSSPEEVRVWVERAAVPWARETPAFGFDREEAAEGGAVFIYRAWDLRRLLPWVLSWGASARVLSPAHVADRVHREAAALAQRYADA